MQTRQKCNRMCEKAARGREKQKKSLFFKKIIRKIGTSWN